MNIFGLWPIQSLLNCHYSTKAAIDNTHTHTKFFLKQAAVQMWPKDHKFCLIHEVYNLPGKVKAPTEYNKKYSKICVIRELPSKR